VRLRGHLRPGSCSALGQSWFRRHGYARLEAPRSPADTATYAAKYLSKDLSRGDVIFWPPRGPLSVHQQLLLACQ
jgi:cell wall-associated NlpC family hydrolase